MWAEYFLEKYEIFWNVETGVDAFRALRLLRFTCIECDMNLNWERERGTQFFFSNGIILNVIYSFVIFSLFSGNESFKDWKSWNILLRFCASGKEGKWGSAQKDKTKENIFKKYFELLRNKFLLIFFNNATLD